MRSIVGKMTKEIADLIGICIADDPMIYLGDTNIKHMQADHPVDYENYGSRIELIVSDPDYVRLDSDGSIEYIKIFVFKGDYVKVAVRLSGGGTYYVRTLYTLPNKDRVNKMIKDGRLKKVKKD